MRMSIAQGTGVFPGSLDCDATMAMMRFVALCACVTEGPGTDETMGTPPSDVTTPPSSRTRRRPRRAGLLASFLDFLGLPAGGSHDYGAL